MGWRARLVAEGDCIVLTLVRVEMAGSGPGHDGWWGPGFDGWWGPAMTGRLWVIGHGICAGAET